MKPGDLLRISRNEVCAWKRVETCDFLGVLAPGEPLIFFEFVHHNFAVVLSKFGMCNIYVDSAEGTIINETW